SREAYPRSQRVDIDGAHARLAELHQPRACGGGVGDERGDVDGLAGGRERTQALDSFFEQDARAMEVAVAPVMKADADLEDAVLERAVRRARVAPEQLERLV